MALLLGMGHVQGLGEGHYRIGYVQGLFKGQEGSFFKISKT